MELETKYVNVSLDSRQYMVKACPYSCHQCCIDTGGFNELTHEDACRMLKQNQSKTHQVP